MTVLADGSVRVHWFPEDVVQPSQDLRIASAAGVAVSVTGSFASTMEVHPSVEPVEQWIG